MIPYPVLLVWKKSKAIRDGRMLWGRRRGLYFSFHLRFDLRTRQQLLTIVPHIGVRNNSLTHLPPSFPFRSALAISNNVLYIHFRSCCWHIWRLLANSLGPRRLYHCHGYKHGGRRTGGLNYIYTERHFDNMSETGPESSWVLIDTARQCSDACRFRGSVFS